MKIRPFFAEIEPKTLKKYPLWGLGCGLGAFIRRGRLLAVLRYIADPFSE